MGEPSALPAASVRHLPQADYLPPPQRRCRMTNQWRCFRHLQILTLPNARCLEERRVLTADLGGNASTSQMGDEAARLVRE